MRILYGAHTMGTETPRLTSGSVLVVSGPGGVGKGTVVAALVASRPDLAVSVSATTRPPRPGERDGRDYHFVDRDTFAAMAGNGEFLEWAEFNGHCYGTPWASVTGPTATGGTVVLEIDVQGATQVRARVPDAVLVFLLPPDMATLEARLRGRGTDDEDTIRRRLALAAGELAQQDRFDHRIVNHRVADTVAAIDRILAGRP